MSCNNQVPELGGQKWGQIDPKWDLLVYFEIAWWSRHIWFSLCLVFFLMCISTTIWWQSHVQKPDTGSYMGWNRVKTGQNGPFRLYLLKTSFLSEKAKKWWRQSLTGQKLTLDKVWQVKSFHSWGWIVRQDVAVPTSGWVRFWKSPSVRPSVRSLVRENRSLVFLDFLHGVREG